jgi:hypothetical protein
MDGRRRLQFGLRSLFWLMLVIAVAIYGIREHRERRRTQAEIAILKFKAAWSSAIHVTPEQVELSAKDW